MLRIGDKVKVWVYLKTRGATVDERPHLIETSVTLGWSTWFSRDVRTAVCGKARKHREGWRAVFKRGDERIPANPCLECEKLRLLWELGE